MIRVGIGGWTYEPWRGTFYPEGLKHADELRYAASKLTSIEINGTFYRTQSAASFAKWRDETPEGFVFAVKGHRAVVNKKVLAEAGEALDWFFKSGITELGDKLGPLLWQFAPYKKFDPDDFGAFLALLPKEADGLKLRHVVEVRSTDLPRAGVRGARRASTMSRWSMPTPTTTRRSPTSPPISSMPACRSRRRPSPPAMPPADLDAWAARAKTGPPGARRTICRASAPSRRRRRSATSSST